MGKASGSTTPAPKAKRTKKAALMKQKAEDLEFRTFRLRIDKRLKKDKNGILDKAVKWFRERGQPVDESATESEAEAAADKPTKTAPPARIEQELHQAQ